jgi:hypothetical protein
MYARKFNLKIAVTVEFLVMFAVEINSVEARIENGV